MYRKTRKLFAVVLTLAMLLTMTGLTTLASASTGTALSGADRYATAINIAKAGWTQSDTVVIARGDELADALAAAPLNAPILLTETGKLPTGVLAEVKALAPKTIYIVGGTGAVSTAVETELKAVATVTRLAGADRVATSVEIAKKVSSPSAYVLASATSYADALSVSAIAAAKAMPILLVLNNKLSADEAALVSGKTVYAVGGTGVLSDAVIGSATRLAGANRYETNAAILSKFAPDYSKIYLARGIDKNLVDALAGSTLAALGKNPIVLVDGNDAINTKVADVLKANLKADTTEYLLGAASSKAATAVEALKPTTLEVKSVTPLNLKEIKIAFTQDVNMAASTDANYVSSALNPVNYSPAGTLTKIDSRTVLLTLKDAVSANAAVSVAVSGIKNSALTKTVVKYATAYIASDSVAPTATASVDVSRVLTINFSEPMASVGNVYVNGTLTTVTLSEDAKKATATLDDTFVAGKSYSVVIVGATDLAGNYMAPNPTTLTITMVNDTVKPAVVSVAPTANATQLNVKFTEAIKDQGTAPTVNYATLTFKDPAGNTVGSSVTVSAAVADTDNLVYSATIDLLSGYTYRYLDVTVSGYKDLAGNAGDSATIRVLLQQDTVAPAYTGVKVASDCKSIIVNFDEKIAIGSVPTAVVSYTANDGIVYSSETITLTDAMLVGKDGAAVTATVPATALQLAPASWTTDGVLKAGTYTITVKAKAVKDAYGNETSTDIVVPVVVGTPTTTDTTAPVLTDAKFVADSIDLIEITSNEDLSAPVLSNIKLDGNPMPTGTKVYLFNSAKTVRIELPANSITLNGFRNLTYTLSDLAGNATTVTKALDFSENVQPVVKTAVLADPKTIVLTTSENVSVATGASITDDFEVYVNGVKATISTVTVSDNKVSITLSSAVALSDTLTVKVVGSDLVDANGNALVSGGTFAVTR